MSHRVSLFLLEVLFTIIAAGLCAAQTPPPLLNVTAITAANGSSIFECWTLLPGFATSTQAGTTGALSTQLGDVSNMSYSILPAGFAPGPHNAPNAQFVVFLTGLAKITLPATNETAIVVGGEKGLIIAVDTADVSTGGHITTYPSREETIALQIPTQGGAIPEHVVAYSGPCKSWVAHTHSF